MVGELPPEVATPQQVEKYLPADLPALLSLATGSEVGTQWIETRDQSGALVSRIHTPTRSLQYTRGHRAIDGIIHPGIGLLLGNGSQSAIFDSPRLRVTTKHLVRGGQSGLTIEDRLSYLIRALDGLCKMEGISGTVSVSDVLDQKQANELKKIVKHAAGEVRKLSEAAKRDGDSISAATYQRVSQRMSNSTTLDNGFGADLTELLHRFHLHDLEVVTKYLETNPRSDKRNWLALISYYRGLVFHSGYIDFDAHPDAAEDAVTILFHLHDLLLRIQLKRLGYTAHYQPTVIKMTAEYALDWVTPETPPRRLGYE